MGVNELTRAVNEHFIFSPLRRATAALKTITDSPDRDIEAVWRDDGKGIAATLRHLPTGVVVGGRGVRGHEYVLLAALLEELATRIRRREGLLLRTLPGEVFIREGEGEWVEIGTTTHGIVLDAGQ